MQKDPAKKDGISLQDNTLQGLRFSMRSMSAPLIPNLDRPGILGLVMDHSGE
jgi:hypothetical protein